MKSNKLILGTVQFGLDYGVNNEKGRPSFKTMCSVFDYAKNEGVKILDTAEIYGNSQERIGRYHEKSLDKFEIITKFSPLRKDLPASIENRVKQNLTTLKVDSLYAYMFHSFVDFKKYFFQFEEDLMSLKRLGLIKKIGVSLHSNAEIEEVLNMTTNITLLQLPFNLLDNSFQRKEILENVRSKKIEIHTRSAFLQGLFFKKKESIEGKLIKLKKYLEEIEQINSKEVKINDLAINYVVKKSYINKVLIGVDSLEQLKDNINSLEKNISSELLKRIDCLNVKEKELLNPANWK